MVKLVHETYVKQLAIVKKKISLEKSKTHKDLRKQESLGETSLATNRSTVAEKKKPTAAKQ